MTINPHESRCINQQCPLNKECALFVKPRRVNEQLFAGRAFDGDCDFFVDLHRHWGEGAEAND